MPTTTPSTTSYVVETGERIAAGGGERKRMGDVSFVCNGGLQAKPSLSRSEVLQ